ncbi:secretory phospholipase A2 receptor isoform X2 [Hyperolius riggenbachi]|uniref:secretory phospholipase A2 receptor isoform X2 n=1 Tax=Hyperolius riggenbachi TaxID=752182 RepID=UPI0035A26B32
MISMAGFLILVGFLLPFLSVTCATNKIYTIGGNGKGWPCVFPFKFNNTLYHKCTKDGRSDGIPWCATTLSYARDGRWGYCPSADVGCNALWEKNQVTKACYQFNWNALLPWSQARSSCQAQGGDLLSITNLEEYKYIAQNPNASKYSFWIGLNQLDPMAGWQWSDGEPFAFVNSASVIGPLWRSKARDVIQSVWNLYPIGEQQCGFYNIRANHTWSTSRCEISKPYACKKRLTPRQFDSFENWKYYPIVCEETWYPFNRHCYKLNREQLNWTQASNACRANGGELIQVHSLAHTEVLLHLLHQENISEAWIGMSSRDKGPVMFQWSDGSDVTFTSWSRHEPTIDLSLSVQCVSAQAADGKWRLEPCSTNMSSICKKPGQDKTSETAEESCDKTFERYGNYCYGIDPEKETYEEAANSSYCPLMTITSRFEQAFINSWMATRIFPLDLHFWIALQDLDGMGEYTWAKDPHMLIFTNWNTEQPSEHGGCVAVSRLSLGRWEVKDCKRFNAMSLCKKPLTTAAEDDEWNPPTEEPKLNCPPGWELELHLPYCYKIFHEEWMQKKRAWQEAENMCQDFGAHLVSFSHLHEEKFVMDLLKSTFNGEHHRLFWIGYNNRNPASEGAWTWSDGTPVVSSFQPEIFASDVTKNCAALGANKTFVPFHCDATLDWVCKLPKGVEPASPDWHTGYNYHFSERQDDYVFTEGLCAFWIRGSLTSIHSEAEQEFIHSRIRKLSEKEAKWWIGLVFQDSFNGLKRWRDGSPVVYSKWDKEKELSIPSVKELQCAYIMSDTGRWGYSNCTDKNWGICKTSRLLKIEIPKSREEDDERTHGTCPADWLFYGYKCFHVYRGEDGQQLDWHSADNYCKGQGGRLAIISNEIEQAFILMQLFGQQKSFWIGNDRDSYELWEYGSPQGFTNWFPVTANHSSASFQDLRCAAIAGDRTSFPAGRWHLENCDHQGYGIICDKKQDTSRSVNASDMFPVPDIVPYGNKSYKFLSGNMSWEESYVACKQYGGDLVTIHNEYHQAFLTIIVHRLGYPHWIGFHSESGRWADGSMPRFTWWAEGPPSQDGLCAYINTNGYWGTLECNAQLQGAVCLLSTENKTTEKINDCPEDWFQFQDVCYTLESVFNNTDYNTAEGICQQQGATVLTILQEEEDTFLRSLLSSLSVDQQGIWLNKITFSNDGTEAWWSDGTPLHYSNWNDEVAYRESMIGKQCVQLLTDSTWLPTTCNDRRGVICKRSANIRNVEDNVTATESRTSHATIPVAVTVTFIILAFSVLGWHLFQRKKRQLKSPGFQDFSCTQPGADDSNMEESILISELEDIGSR